MSRRAAATSSSFPSLAKCCAIKTIIVQSIPSSCPSPAPLALPEVFTAELLVERVQLLVGVVVDDQCAATLFCRAKPDASAERPLQPVDERLAQRRITVALGSGRRFLPRTPAGRGIAGSPAPHQLFRLTDTKPLLQHPLQGGHLLRRRRQSEESPGVSLADLTRAKHALHAVRKGQQPERIGDAGAGAA